jgi:hypothetical protein
MKMIQKQVAKNCVTNINKLIKIQKNLTDLFSYQVKDPKDENAVFIRQQIDIQIRYLMAHFKYELRQTGWELRPCHGLTGYFEICKGFPKPSEEELAAHKSDEPDQLPSK